MLEYDNRSKASLFTDYEHFNINYSTADHYINKYIQTVIHDVACISTLPREFFIEF